VASGPEGRPFRLIIGTPRPATTNFSSSEPTISPDFPRRGWKLRRKIFRDFVLWPKQQIHVNATRPGRLASLLLKGHGWT